MVQRKGGTIKVEWLLQNPVSEVIPHILTIKPNGTKTITWQPFYYDPATKYDKHGKLLYLNFSKPLSFGIWYKIESVSRNTYNVRLHFASKIAKWASLISNAELAENGKIIRV